MNNNKEGKPYIPIILADDALKLGTIISYSLEEHGIPYSFINENNDFINNDNTNLGLIVLVNKECVEVYSDDYITNEPIILYNYTKTIGIDNLYSDLRIIGDNISNIVHKRALKEVGNGTYIG